ASERRLGGVLAQWAVSRVDDTLGADLERERAAVRLGLDHGNRAAHRGCGQRAEKPDRAATDDGDLVAGIDAVCGDRCAVRDREWLDECALPERELVGDAVQP